jgi:hypothetical protein
MNNQNKAIQSTTQNFLDIYDITNNMIIMKDGSVAVILTVSAMNFGLLAEAEQDAIIYAYAALLNSLAYPIQIVIQSQTKDATAYLAKLKEQEKKASAPTKKKLIQDYSLFVSNLIKQRNVLDKKFYVVIPASTLELGFISAQSFIPGSNKFDITSIDKTIILEKAINLLEPKIDHLIAQFNRIGLFANQLNTQEIIQVFYNNYNPEASEGQKIADTSHYSSALVGADMAQTANNNPAQQSSQASQEVVQVNLEAEQNNPPLATEPLAQNPANQINVEQSMPNSTITNQILQNSTKEQTVFNASASQVNSAQQQNKQNMPQIAEL